MTIQALKERARALAITRGVTMDAILQRHGLRRSNLCNLGSSPQLASLATCARLISLASEVRDPGTAAMFSTGEHPEALIVIPREQLEQLMAGSVRIGPDIEVNGRN